MHRVRPGVQILTDVCRAARPANSHQSQPEVRRLNRAVKETHLRHSRAPNAVAANAARLTAE